VFVVVADWTVMTGGRDESNSREEELEVCFFFFVISSLFQSISTKVDDKYKAMGKGKERGMLTW
jgi:hypothetical protein